MDLIIKLEKKYSRTQLYNYCKDNKIENVQNYGNMIRLKSLLNSYKEKRHYKYLILMIVFLVQINQIKGFKFDESIFSTEKPLQKILRKDRDIDVREGTTTKLA